MSNRIIDSLPRIMSKLFQIEMEPGTYLFINATGGEKMFNEFGRFLRAYRIPRGMLLYDMAMDLSMSLALLSGYENGRYSIPPFVKQQLIETYPDMDCEKLEKVIEKVNKEVRT